MDKSRRITISAISVVVIVLVVITITLANNQDGPADEICQPRAEKPVRHLGYLDKLHSSDYKITMSSAAYIRLPDAGYIELNPKSVSVEQYDSKRGQVTLENDCAVLKFDYGYIEPYIHIRNLEWTLHNGLGTNYSVCQDHSFYQTFSQENRLLYVGPLVQHCKAYEPNGIAIDDFEPVGELVFDLLEVEFDSNPEVIERGEFSKWSEIKHGKLIKFPGRD